jgi:hypothetical protein
MDDYTPMTAESVVKLLEEAGARVMVRSGRSESYGAPREFTFEVRAVFPNGMGLRVTARQFNYRDPWEAFFQGIDEECEVDEEQLKGIITCVAELNPKLYLLQELTGDL